MSYLIFLGGMFTGIAITRLFYQETSGHGYFTVMPYSDDEISIDEGFYSVKVSLTDHLTRNVRTLLRLIGTEISQEKVLHPQMTLNLGSGARIFSSHISQKEIQSL